MVHCVCIEKSVILKCLNCMMMYKKICKLQELEASIYSQRQSLLAEMDSLKVREADTKRQSELDKQMMAVERERIKIKEEELAAREALMRQTANEKAQK